ncbi:hypothetical protein EEL33_03960 [Muribaculaceae bacterium Isolate-037 (Harlan)]|nr:hypothetical protein EEL33_03960 [Muribaculaceae bacterium Isolate-037 (Harlan)]
MNFAIVLLIKGNGCLWNTYHGNFFSISGIVHAILYIKGAYIVIPIGYCARYFLAVASGNYYLIAFAEFVGGSPFSCKIKLF